MGGFGSTLGLLFEINADPSQAEAALKLFQDQVTAIERLRQGFSDLSASEWAYATTAQRVASVIESSTTASIEASAASIVGMIAGRKAEAAVNAVFYGAEGALHLAEGIWPPNPALIARGLGEIAAAAQYARVAGTSSGGGGHAAGAGAGYGGREPRFLESGSRKSEVGSRGSAGGGGTTVVFNVSGHLITGPETAEWMAGQLSDYVQNRDGELMSSRTKDSTLSRDSLNG
jgi:predicted lactoylglutathione lyase